MAVCDYNVQPSEFWAMKIKHLFWLYRYKNPERIGPLLESDYERLMEALHDG